MADTDAQLEIVVNKIIDELDKRHATHIEDVVGRLFQKNMSAIISSGTGGLAPMPVQPSGNNKPHYGHDPRVQILAKHVFDCMMALGMPVNPDIMALKQ